MVFSKRRQVQVEELLSRITDLQDTELVVVRGPECKIVYMNTHARRRLSSGASGSSCKASYSMLYSGLCEQCAAKHPPASDEAVTFDKVDEQGDTYSITCTVMPWVDGDDATVILARDVQKIRNAEQKLYTLAYVDQLTGAPNRQKFKEDFEKVSSEIGANRLNGVVAIFDLDNFKNINDSYGHNTGDIMLSRLAGHLTADPDFKGHLYRLGGDEFVLFYIDKPTLFPTHEDCKHHYEELLQNALQVYTLPNIEGYCTISMGAAFFPRHGTNTSELLRKADIALYKAKASGRNQLIFFEDQYDQAKRFKDLYINIQPILLSVGRTFGYELIDRGSEDKFDERAVNLNEFDRTLDALGLEDINNDAKYFISYTNQLHNETVRNNLPKDKFIIDVHVPNTVKDEDLLAYKKLRSYGYRIAMTGLKPANATATLLALADYCKFEPRTVSALMQTKIIKHNVDKTFIAGNVNTREEFEEAKRQGYKLFQGFYFSQTPVVTKKTKEIDPLKVNYFRLLKLTSTEGYVDFQEISSIISSDVALSYKLLKLLNSAAVGLRHRISSISMAVAYLGEDNLKKWIALLALRGVSSDKPLELLRMSLIRAQFGELIAPHVRPRRDPKQVFLVGMFSLLHIAMDKTKEELLNEMPVSEDIRNSLLTSSGLYSDFVSFFSNYEYSNWEEINRFADDRGITPQLINDSYIAAVKWYNELVESD